MQQPTPFPAERPTQPPAQRIVELDALRGVAILGIIVMNVLFFTMPTIAYFNPRVWGGMDLANQAVWLLSFVLIEDKMRNLFAMLFGAGVLIMLGKLPGHDKPDATLSRHVARMLWLLVIGLAHAILLANNDILRVYAVAGLILPLLAGLSVRWLIALAVICMGLHLAGGAYYALPWLELYWDSEAPARAERLAPAETLFGADPARLERELGRQAGPYISVIMHRAGNISGIFGYVAAALPTTLAAMLSGMALLKSGFLSGQWQRRDYAKAMLWAGLVGLLPLSALGYSTVVSGYHAVVVAGNALVWSAPFDLSLAIGWAALLIQLVQHNIDAPLTVRVIAAGRMALTNYLMTSLVLGFVFFGFGLGLFGSVSRIGAMAVALAMMILILAWSRPWLQRFGQGPMEWLWRALVRRSIGHGVTR
ncbi:MAG: DUF418 domain-containing protein [Pseudomonadota bacterium]